MSNDDREPIGQRRSKPKSKKLASNKPATSNERDDIEFGSEPIEINDEVEKHMPSKKEKQKKRKGGFFSFMIKIIIIIIIILFFYGVYLDSLIRHKIDGKVWDLPAAVYGRIAYLEPGMEYNQKDMINLLEETQYRQVSSIIRSGEFTVKGNTIELLRRPFKFPDGEEGAIRAKLYFANDQLDRIENVENKKDFAFFRLDPRLITMLQSANDEQRLFVPRNVFPESLVKTLIATEDRHFYEHDGISLYSIGRAFLANITAGRMVQGGSTLTQQLVKNLFLSNERSLKRKINEAYMALILDHRYSKDRILELYLNEVYLGQSGADQIRGFPLASLYYFGRPVDELSLDQQAMLVGMMKGASLYNPWKNPKGTLERRNVVLKLLETQGIIDRQLYETLSSRPLGVQPRGGVITPQPAFMQLVRQELQQKLGDKVTHLSGAKIFTTLDPVSQGAAEKALSEGVPELIKSRKLKDLDGAVVVLDRKSGEVRALVGGAETQFAGFNRALQAKRSIGSLAKPATYLTALKDYQHYRLNSWLADQPIAVTLPDKKVWQPQNDDRNYRGQVMLIDALSRSLNVPTVNLGMTLGLPNIMQTLTELGVDKDAIKPMPSLLLGAINLTPIQVAQMFQTIGSMGYKAPISALRFVISEDDKPIYQSLPTASKLESTQAAYLTLYAMQQVPKSGTARRVLAQKYGKYNLAGKTGTTNNLIDSWFVGIDGREVVTVWIGRDNNETSKLSGASGALTIYRRYLEENPPLPLELMVPEGVHMMNVAPDGHFICDGDAVPDGSRQLPIWTGDPNALCQSDLQPIIQYMPNTDPAATGEQQQDAPQWLHDLFG